jgi:hypothetical protein
MLSSGSDVRVQWHSLLHSIRADNSVRADKSGYCYYHTICFCVFAGSSGPSRPALPLSDTERRIAVLEQQRQALAPFIIPDRCTVVTRVGAAAAASPRVEAPPAAVVGPSAAAAQKKPATSGVGSTFARFACVLC